MKSKLFLWTNNWANSWIGRKKKRKTKKWTSFSIWKISMWSPNIRRGNPWDDGGLPAQSSRTQNEGSVWSQISTGVPRPRRKNAKRRFYFHSLLSFLYYFHFLFLFLIYFENFFFFYSLEKIGSPTKACRVFKCSVN